MLSTHIIAIHISLTCDLMILSIQIRLTLDFILYSLLFISIIYSCSVSLPPLAHLPPPLSLLLLLLLPLPLLLLLLLLPLIPFTSLTRMHLMQSVHFIVFVSSSDIEEETVYLCLLPVSYLFETFYYSVEFQLHTK